MEPIPPYDPVARRRRTSTRRYSSKSIDTGHDGNTVKVPRRRGVLLGVAAALLDLDAATVLQLEGHGTVREAAGVVR
jgi:hypothetical protein